MADLQTMDIHGKPYVTVNVRIQEFRTNEKYKDYSLETEILKMGEGKVVMQASIRNPEGRVIAQGIAMETHSPKNAKYIENCETSAWGRALGNIGIGINESIASADEMNSYHSTQKTTYGDNPKEAPSAFSQPQAPTTEDQEAQFIADQFGGEVMNEPVNSGNGKKCPGCSKVVPSRIGSNNKPYFRCFECNQFLN